MYPDMYNVYASDGFLFEQYPKLNFKVVLISTRDIRTFPQIVSANFTADAIYGGGKNRSCER